MFVYGDLTGWALTLIAIAMAYFVCLKASKEGSKLFKYAGYTIGLLILVLSLVLAVTNVVNRIRRPGFAKSGIGKTPARSVIAPRAKTPMLPKKITGTAPRLPTIPTPPPQQPVPQPEVDRK